MMKGKKCALLIALLSLISLGVAIGSDNESTPSAPKLVSNPALSVSVIHPEIQDIQVSLTANGSIAAWQEAIIGAEVGDLRLSAVNVQVGETIKKGQVLATWKSPKQSYRLDSKRLEIEHPELILQYQVPIQNSRRLVIKELKSDSRANDSKAQASIHMGESA